MLKHAKLIGVVSLGAAAAVTFVVIGTAGKPTAPPVLTGFAGAQVSPSPVDINCKAGATTGTAAVQVKATGPIPSGATLGTGQRILVTWTGGSATIFEFNRFYNAGPTFPCPPLATADVSTPFSFQVYKGSTTVGAPVLASATFHRVGSPS